MWPSKGKTANREQNINYIEWYISARSMNKSSFIVMLLSIRTIVHSQLHTYTYYYYFLNLLLLLLLFFYFFYFIIIKGVLLECRWVKITSRTLYKWNSKIKSGEHRWEKVKVMTWQKDAFSGDTWRCRVSQTQWRWMTKCSRCAVQRRKTCYLQSSYDMMMAWQEQTLTQIASSK